MESRLSHPRQPRASKVGTHCKPCYLSPLIGFRWLLFPSLHYVKGAVLCCAKSLRSCPTLWDPMDCSLPDSSVHGDSPGKHTGVGCHALPPGDLPNPGIEPVSFMSPGLAGRFFTTSATWEASAKLPENTLPQGNCLQCGGGGHRRKGTKEGVC